MTSAIILLGLLAVATLAQFFCARVDAQKFPAPGTVVHVPGGQMHVCRQGSDGPAVVLEAGIAASSLNWRPLQAELAVFTTVYSYDRAGFGWSIAASKNCSLARMTRDLHDLLSVVEIRHPYILVAHSFGAYIATAYAQHFSHELAGIVLVDPLTPQEWIQPTPEQRWRLRRGVWFSRAGGVVAAVGVLRACLWLLQRGKPEAPRRILHLFGTQATETVQHILGELAKLPPDVVRAIRARWSRPHFFWTMAKHIGSLPACAAELNGCSIPAHIPVTVLSGAHQPEVRMKEHAAIATNSSRGRHILAEESAHWVHLDQPGLVVEAVREMAAESAAEKAISKWQTPANSN